MTDQWNKLRSGTDIRGIAIAERGETPMLNEAVGVSVGRAFARWLSARAGRPSAELTVYVGRDPRLTGLSLAAALASGLTAEGVSVVDCGLCTTPAMFMTTLLASSDGAVMVTASHLPWQRNGYKFFTPQGGLGGEDITKILRDAENLPPVPGKATPRQVDFLLTYSEFLAQKIHTVLGDERPLDGLRVVVDAGNGAGGFYAALLKRLGADITGSLFLAPDGRFPNHAPNPEAQEAMQALSRATLDAHADLGVIFDADCDRMALVDGEGKAINQSRLIALVSAVLLQERPGITVVTDSVSSAGLAKFLMARGGVLHRFKRGYRNVIDEAVRLNRECVDCPLAIETSGHAALRENHFLDDGMYLATRLIIEAMQRKRQGLGLFSLIEGLEEPIESAEIRLAIVASDFRSLGEAVLGEVQSQFAQKPGYLIDPANHEGVRVELNGPSAWFLLRLSLHDPLMVLNLESESAGGIASMRETLRSVLSKWTDLNLSTLV